MKTRILSLLLIVSLCCANAEQIVLDDAVGYLLDENTMTACLNRSTYPYGLIPGYTRDTEVVRDTIHYEGKEYPVIGIGERAFFAQDKLKGITIPYGIKYIGKQAFAICSSLQELILPNSVDSLEESFLFGCSSIAKISLPKGIKLSSGVLAGSSKLLSVFVDSDIPDCFVQNCSKLSSIKVGNLCTSIGRDAFNGCSALTEISIPSSVESIGVQAFSNAGLLSINIPSQVKVIEESTFWGCKNLNSVELGIGVRKIEKSAFWNCSSLTNITIPEQMEYVGLNAFIGCSSLTSVVWNAKNCAIFDVTSQRPFSQIEMNFTSFEFGSEVQSIPNNLCNGMQNLEQVTAYMINPPQISPSVFANCGNLKNIVCYVPAESLGAYKNAEVWKEFKLTAIGQQPEEPIFYTVTFNDWNGSVLKNEQVEEGHTATAPANPTREGYTFTGWDKDFSNIQSDLTVTALYVQNSPIATYFIVTFKDWDGSVLKSEQVEEGHAAMAPANPTREGYTFIGWDKDFSNIQSDLTVTALYVQNSPIATYFIVTFKDWDGSVLKSEQVEEGHAATAPTNPTREGYTFTGWDKDFSNVQSDLIVTAVYEKDETPVTNAITVRLKASSASSWSKVNLYYWADGVASPAWPGISINKDADEWYSYTFDASIKSVNIIWNDGNNQTVDITNITESSCYSLNSSSGKNISVSMVECPPEILYYIITFKDWDGSILKSEQVEEGHAAMAPANPTREGYTFIGWDKDFSNVQSDLIVTAVYEKDEAPVTNAITVRLNASSASGWSKVNLYYWADGVDSPAWPGISINKDANGWYSYTFDASIKSVNIIWNDGNNQTVDITNITESICHSLNSSSGNKITVTITDCGTQDLRQIEVGDTPYTKVLHNGQIFILRGDKIYTLTGQEVK